MDLLDLRVVKGLLCIHRIQSKYIFLGSVAAVCNTPLQLVGPKQVQEYIRNQLQENQIADQIGLKEFADPFTGRENK